MENENITIENTVETEAVESPNKNMKPCKVCGKQIAKKAKTCPYCGAKNKKSHKGLIALLIIIFVAAMVVVNPFGNNSTANTKKNNVVLKIEGGEEITVKELIAMNRENQAKFKNNYQGKSVSFIGTVKEVKYDYYSSSVSSVGDMNHHDSIIFEGGIELELHHGDHDDILLNISAGDKLSVRSEIQSTGFYGITIYNVHGIPWHDESIISIVK